MTIMENITEHLFGSADVVDKFDSQMDGFSKTAIADDDGEILSEPEEGENNSADVRDVDASSLANCVIEPAIEHVGPKTPPSQRKQDALIEDEQVDEKAESKFQTIVTEAGDGSIIALVDNSQHDTGADTSLAMVQKEKVQEENLTKPTAVVEDGPKCKKSALEHLRSMKFSKSDPFNDSTNRDQRSFRLNREELVNDIESENRLKRIPSTDDSNRRKRYRDASSPSAAADATSDQKRQRSIMYFLQQNANDSRHNSHGSQQHYGGQHGSSNNNNNKTRHYSDGNNNTNNTSTIINSNSNNSSNNNNASTMAQLLPANIKSSIQTSGHLKQKIESLLTLTDDQVFSLAGDDLEALIMYTVELSVEQDRLLSGRKAQLKQLDQMIQKERELIDRVVQELPAQLRASFATILDENSSATRSVAPIHAPIGSIGIQDVTGLGTASIQPNQNSQAQHQSQPQALPVDFSIPISSTFINASQPTQFSQPPPVLPVAVESVAVGGLAPPTAATLDFSKPPPIPTATDFSKPPPPTDFSKPPPHLVLSQQQPSVPSTLQSMPTTSVAPSSSIANAPIPSAAVAAVAGGSISFTNPPPPITVPVTASSLSSLVVPSPSSQINTSVPPPNLATIATPVSNPTLIAGPPPPSVVTNLKAPPPPIDFSLPPPSAGRLSSSLENQSQQSCALTADSRTIKTSHSSSNLTGLSDNVGENEARNVLPLATMFSVPPPTIQTTPSNLASKVSTAPPLSSNITAALDLSVPPPSLTRTSTSSNAGLETLLPFTNLSRPPPNMQQNQPQQQKSLPISTAAMHQISRSIIASVAASLNRTQQRPTTTTAKPLFGNSPSKDSPQQQTRGAVIGNSSSAPRPLMSIEPALPMGFRPGVSGAAKPSLGGIPSLASISQKSITIKRTPKPKAQSGKLLKRPLATTTKTIATSLSDSSTIIQQIDSVNAVDETTTLSSAPIASANPADEAANLAEKSSETLVDNTEKSENFQQREEKLDQSSEVLQPQNGTPISVETLATPNINCEAVNESSTIDFKAEAVSEPDTIEPKAETQ